MRSGNDAPLLMAEEVRAALAAGGAVVALETSIVAQGFPPPENLAVGRAMAEAVRAAGAVPAMIAIADGKVRVGVDDDLLARLAGEGAVKCSARDIAPVLAAGRLGATTVAATAAIAASLGIRVFATGGIGGVHRRMPGEEGPPDVSADLVELSRRSLAVITSGAKSILDLPATLEQIESLGIAAIGYRTDRFPAFHTAESGLRLRHRVEDAGSLARILRVHLSLGLGGALLVCNPPPAELAMAAADLEGLIREALAEAAARGISGPEVTPHLLGALDRLSGGRTRRVNFALAVSNARLGGEIAAAL
ncbi:MAG: pseudouridine-5'-phosphate glycosidase [Alphaproteobacteria bacterium]|nr:pseudouridine-5'-phosphate glycosidase [Alphaproteobacteria bacterium]